MVMLMTPTPTHSCNSRQKGQMLINIVDTILDVYLDHLTK